VKFQRRLLCRKERCDIEADQAKAAARDERERAEQQARDEFERRSQAEARAKYTTHDVGYGAGATDPNEASAKQYAFIEFLGMKIDYLTRKQAGRIIDQLLHWTTPEEVSKMNRLPHWELVGPSEKQLKFMRWQNVPTEKAVSKRTAGLLIDAKLEPDKFVAERMDEFAKATNNADLDGIAKSLLLVRGVLPADSWHGLAAKGRQERDRVGFDGIPE